MVATPEIRSTQGDVLAATTGTSPGTLTTQGMSLVALNFPTDELRAGTVQTVIAAPPFDALRTSQAAVLVAIRGRTRNPTVRAWTFTLDGHDYYVLRLGMLGTLVYDVYSEQWMDWDAFGEIYWPVNLGFNWVDGQGITGVDGVFNSNVLVGDDTLPILYFLDPTQGYDDSPDSSDPDPRVFFERTIQGQVPMVGREVLPCYSVWLTTDMGDPAYSGAGVTLEISDDAGKTYDDMGTVTVTAGENSPELAWYSLGQIAAPGRLFRITDDGAVARIDNMEMNDPDDEK